MAIPMVPNEPPRGPLRTARRMGPERAMSYQPDFRCDDLDPSQKYDLLLCTEVIEHTADPKRVIANIASLVSPGGVAIITLPNRISFPFLSAYLIYKLKNKPKNLEFEEHLNYPFYRTLG